MEGEYILWDNINQCEEITLDQEHITQLKEDIQELTKMIEKYEKLEGEGEEKSFKETTKSNATHIHYCYHDKFLADGKSYKPCRRVKI